MSVPLSFGKTLKMNTKMICKYSSAPLAPSALGWLFMAYSLFEDAEETRRDNVSWHENGKILIWISRFLVLHFYSF